MFRHDEMGQIKASHITQLADGAGLTIFISRSKTDIYRKGNVAHLANSTEFYNPVQILKGYLEMCKIDIGQDKYIFTLLSFQSNVLLQIGLYKSIMHIENENECINSEKIALSD